MEIQFAISQFVLYDTEENDMYRELISPEYHAAHNQAIFPGAVSDAQTSVL